MFCVRRMLEIFLKMHKSTGGLNQSFEKITVVGVAIEPKLFQDIVCFVVTLLESVLWRKRSISSPPSSRTKREILSPLLMKGLISSCLR